MGHPDALGDVDRGAGAGRASIGERHAHPDQQRPFTNASSQHATEVEPDTFASGSTVVSAFQVGRVFDGGASDIGFARSTDGGSTWTHGFLPGLTVNGASPGSTGAPFHGCHLHWELPADGRVRLLA